MAKKKGGGKKKKTKEELEAERLLAEEEERIRQEEEAQRLAEEEALRLEREEQERLERERLRREELERLGEEASTTKPLVDRRRRYRDSHLRGEFQTEDWNSFLTCSPLPQRDSDADINTYLKAIVTDDGSDMDYILSQCEVLHQVSGLLSSSRGKDVASGAYGQITARRTNALNLLTSEIARIDRSTANLLVRAEEFISPKLEVLLGNTSKNFGVGIWINMASKGFRMRIIDFPSLSIIAEIPKTLALQSVAVRVVHILDDALSQPAHEEDMEYDTAKGGMLFFETLKLPPQSKPTKGWAMRPINPALENRVMRVSFNSNDSSVPGASPTSPDPSGNGPIAVALKMKIPKTCLVRSIHGEHQPLVLNTNENSEGESGDDENRMPDALAVAQQQAQNSLMEGTSVRVGAWDPNLCMWVEDGVSDVSFDPSTRVLSFTTIKNTAHALLQRRDIDHPFRSWTLTPQFANGRASMTKTSNAGEHSVNTESKLDEDSVDPFEMVTEDIDPSANQSPTVHSAIISLRTSSWVIKIEIFGRGKCKLLEPQEPELAHIVNNEMRPEELFALLAESGIDLRSPVESSAIAPGTQLLNGRVALKNEKLERHVYGELSAAVSSAFLISTSRWNQQVGPQNCCFNIQEAYESADSGLDLDAVIRQELGECSSSDQSNIESMSVVGGAAGVQEENGTGEHAPGDGTVNLSEAGAHSEEAKAAEDGANAEAAAKLAEEKAAEAVEAAPVAANSGKKAAAKKGGKKDKKKDKEEQARLEAEAAAAAASAAAALEAEAAAAALIEPDPLPSEPRLIFFQIDEEVPDTGLKCNFLRMKESDETLDTTTVSKDQVTHAYLENALMASEIYCQDRIHKMQDDPSTTGLRETIKQVLCTLRPLTFTL